MHYVWHILVLALLITRPLLFDSWILFYFYTILFISVLMMNPLLAWLAQIKWSNWILQSRDQSPNTINCSSLNIGVALS